MMVQRPIRQRLIFLLILFGFFLNQNVSAEINSFQEKTESIVRKVKFYTEQKNKFPNLSHADNELFLKLKVLQYNYDLSHSDKDFKATNETLKFTYQSNMNYHFEKCSRGNKLSCEHLISSQNEYKQKYNVDYKPVLNLYPSIDYEKMTYSMPDGKVFGFNSADSLQFKPLNESRPVEVVTKTNVNNCEWIPSSYNRVLSGKNCSADICSAYVVCEKNNRKSKRLATCSADLCNSKNATACAEQKGYGSIAVNFESAEVSSANSLQQGNKTKNNK